MKHKKLKSGLIWSVIEVVIKRGLDFFIKLVLARLLFPEDFGVVGMAMVFVSFIQVLNEAGMGLAIVQNRGLTNKHLNTVFWSNLGWSISLYLIMSFFIAPLAAKFYNQQILIEILPVLSLSILMRALNSVHAAQLKRDLEFKKLATINNISILGAGIIAIILALLGVGVWAIVINTLLINFISIPLYYKATKWLPCKEFDTKLLKEILSFGAYTTATQVLLNFVNNADYLLLGKFIGPTAVGVYTIAYMMTNQVTGQISTMVDRVMFPFYSSIQDRVDDLNNYYIKQVNYYIVIIYPIMLTVLLFSNHLIEILFGVKWNEASMPAQILAIAVMINVLTSGYNLLFRSVGKPAYEFKIQRINTLGIYLPLLILGIYSYGLIGAAYAVLISNIIVFFINRYVLYKHFRLKIGRVFIENKQIFYISFILFILVNILRFFNFNEVFVFAVYIVLLGGCYYSIFKKQIIKLVRG